MLAETIFISELAFQIKIAQCAAKRLPLTPANFDRYEVWCSIQSLLVAAANVSKILWPMEKHRARGEHLRNVLQIDEHNILSERKFRNHFEHYDDRIEAWFNKQSSAVYQDLVIDPFKSIWGDDPRLTTNQNRGYNPLTKVLTFRGESIDLAAVLKALEEILSKCSYFVLT